MNIDIFKNKNKTNLKKKVKEALIKKNVQIEEVLGTTGLAKETKASTSREDTFVKWTKPSIIQEEIKIDIKMEDTVKPTITSNVLVSDNYLMEVTNKLKVKRENKR